MAQKKEQPRQPQGKGITLELGKHHTSVKALRIEDSLCSQICVIFQSDEILV